MSYSFSCVVGGVVTLMLGYISIQLVSLSFAADWLLFSFVTLSLITSWLVLVLSEREGTEDSIRFFV